MIALTLSLGRILITLITGEIKALLQNKRNMIFPAWLGQNFFGHVAVHISQAEVAPGVVEGELLVVETQ